VPTVEKRLNTRPRNCFFSGEEEKEQTRHLEKHLCQICELEDFVTPHKRHPQLQTKFVTGSGNQLMFTQEGVNWWRKFSSSDGKYRHA
jgi:hypothetical protein